MAILQKRGELQSDKLDFLLRAPKKLGIDNPLAEWMSSGTWASLQSLKVIYHNVSTCLTLTPVSFCHTALSRVNIVTAASMAPGQHIGANLLHYLLEPASAQVFKPSPASRSCKSIQPCLMR